MSFKDLVIESQSFKVSKSGDTVVLRGLGLDSILFLLRAHGEPLQAVYAQAVAGGVDASNVGALASSLLDESPIIIGSIIACAAGEPDQFAKAAQLPAPLQLEMLEAVCRMTLEMAGGLGKFMETVNRLLESLAMQKASPTG